MTTMDDARTRHTADAREVRTMVQERIHKRAGEMSRRGMNNHPRRLVDDDHVLVLKDDVERNILGFGDGRNGRRNLNDDLVVFGDLHPRLLGDRAVDRHKTGFDESLDSRPREAGMRFKNLLVDTFDFRF